MAHQHHKLPLLVDLVVVEVGLETVLQQLLDLEIRHQFLHHKVILAVQEPVYHLQLTVGLGAEVVLDLLELLQLLAKQDLVDLDLLLQ